MECCQVRCLRDLFSFLSLSLPPSLLFLSLSHTHTHKYTHMLVYIYHNCVGEWSQFPLGCLWIRSLFPPSIWRSSFFKPRLWTQTWLNQYIRSILYFMRYIYWHHNGGLFSAAKFRKVLPRILTTFMEINIKPDDGASGFQWVCLRTTELQPYKDFIHERFDVTWCNLKLESMFSSGSLLEGLNAGTINIQIGFIKDLMCSCFHFTLETHREVFFPYYSVETCFRALPVFVWVPQYHRQA